LDGPRAGLARAVARLAEALDNLRELSQGLHPAALSRGGLEPALRTLARRLVVPVALHPDVGGRLAEEIEVAAYFVVSEALANAANHAHASLIDVRATARADARELTLRDDGTGGADPARGSGLFGLIDRVDALGGRIGIASPPGEGTALHVRLPLAAF